MNLAQEEPESGVFDDDDDCTFRVNSFTANTKYGEKATVRVGGVPVDMLVDSGSKYQRHESETLGRVEE